HAAAVLTEVDDLGIDLIGRAAEHDCGVDQVLHTGGMHVDEATVPGPAALALFAAQDAGIVLDRKIAWRIAELRRHDAGRAQIAGDEFSPRPRGALVRRHRDEAQIAEPVCGWRRPARRHVTDPVSVKQGTRGKAGAERRHHIALLAEHPRIATPAEGAPTPRG